MHVVSIGAVVFAIKLLLIIFTALLQLMAATEAGRGVHYFAFGDHQLNAELSTMYTYLKQNRVRVCAYFTIIQYY